MSDAQVVASAPGKVVLSGEYAVLDGAPAISMAVDARAVVTIGTTGAAHHTVVAPGYCDRATRFRDRDGVLDWQDDGTPFELLAHVWRLSQPRPAASLALNLDTRAFFDAARTGKYGIGSSAALAVALAAALAPADDALDVAHRAHSDLQGGSGSGVDVATSAAGGLLEYRMQGRQSGRLEWPRGLAWQLLWSGSGSQTGAKIERYEQGGGQHSKTALGDAAERIAGAWRRGSAAAILDAYRDYTSALERLGVDHGLGIFDAGHAELFAAANAAGLVYKPCGAGGGDVGIVLASDARAIDDFIAGGLPAGFTPLHLGFDSRGVEVEGKRL